MAQVKKAVFPAAGLGSRFLPATKANPKEMLSVVDKPLIQYAVEEAIRAGITHMIFVVNSSKQVIEEHFDKNLGLETLLEKQGKNKLLELVKEISPPDIQFTYVRQPQALGLGHAILCAKHLIENEPFAVLLPDDLLDDAKNPCLSKMAKHYEQNLQSLVAVQPVPWANVSQYGVVTGKNDPQESFFLIDEMVEKPAPNFATSNLAAIGRYIFTPEIFSTLEQTSIDQHEEIQLTGAIQRLLLQEKVFAYKYPGIHYDCGSKLGYLKATVELGLKHPDVGQEFNEYLRSNVSFQ